MHQQRPIIPIRWTYKDDRTDCVACEAFGDELICIYNHYSPAAAKRDSAIAIAHDASAIQTNVPTETRLPSTIEHIFISLSYFANSIAFNSSICFCCLSIISLSSCVARTNGTIMSPCLSSYLSGLSKIKLSSATSVSSALAAITS